MGGTCLPPALQESIPDNSNLFSVHRSATRYLLGCVGLLTLLCGVGCIGVGFWLFREPRIEIPPRRYPPDNAYDAYRELGKRIKAEFDRDARLREVERRLFSSAEPTKAPAEDYAYYLERMRPYLEEYPKHLNRPSVAVFEYDVHWQFPELPNLRRIARAESLLMKEDIRRGRPFAAVQRAHRLARLAEQVRNEGVWIQYLVGMALLAFATAPLREELPSLNDANALDAIVQMVREYETRRIPAVKAMQQEYYMGLSAYRDLASGRLSYDQIVRNQQPSPSGIATLIARPIVNTALPEYQRLMNQLIRDLKKPYWERADTEPAPKHPLNMILVPVFARASGKEAQEIATMRLLGCAAAIKRFKQRTGRYPATLDELQLGQISIDPYSGKPFIYRTDPRRGFLLYSVSENRVDDGGWSPYRGVATSKGDMTPVRQLPPEPLRRKKTEELPLNQPLWLK
ncbi:MAG: hypothetical protein ABDI19_03995 [Armatimonadota bacterium]